MKNYIKTFLQYRTPKEMMLIGLYAASISVYIFYFIVALIIKENSMVFCKFSVTVIMTMLFVNYLKTFNVKLFVILLILVFEIDIAITILSYHVFNVATIYPFILIFGFFYFFKLKNALIATGLHYIYWIIVITYGFYLYPIDHPIFSPAPIINMFTNSFIILIFSLFYYYSTEVSYQKLEKSNKQNNILLNEIHHRIKNNLNIIASILGLQVLNLENNKKVDAKEVLVNSKLRIEAIALIHESLYKNNNIEKIIFQKYIQNLTSLISKTYNKNIVVNVDSDHISLPMEPMFRLGLIINELFTNSLKYAFTNSKNGVVNIFLEKNENRYLLKYHESNNDNIDIQKILNSDTLGIKLINLTVKQMDAAMDISRNNGLIFTIKFSDEK